MAITTLRPSGIVIQAYGNVTVTGAANATAAVNDNSDASYIKGSVDRMYIRYTLDDISLTATQRVRSVGIRIRNAKDSSGTGYQATQTVLNMGVPGQPSIGGLTNSRGLTSIGTTPGPLCYAAPGGLAWTQALVNGLQVQCMWFKASGTAGWQRVHELYVDVDTNDQPSAGAVTVTNFTNNARPNIAWVYTDADSDPQFAFRGKIFDSVTYGAAGFSADTSTPVYDTGDVVGDATNFDLTSDLQQGVTYKAWVKAGQAWPGPQGPIWYSVWSLSAPFALVFSAPYTPTLTATLLTGTQNYRTSLAVTAPVNVLTSDAASFESSVGGWIASANMAGPTTNTTDAADGTHSLTLSSSAAGDMVARGPAVSVDGGTSYTALCSFHAATAGRSCNVGVRWFSITGAAIGADVYGGNITDVTTAGVYTQASLVSSVAPGNAVTASVLAKVQATAAGAEVHRIDKASLAVTSSTSWTPGATSTAHTLYLERGERVSHRRGPAENWAHSQVASGGSVLQDPTYGFKWDITKDLAEWIPLDKTLTGGSPYGMVHWSPRDPASSVTILRIGSSQNSPETDWNFPVVAGSTHAGSFWAWVATGTLAVTPKIEWLNDDGTVNSTTTGGTPTLTTTPQQILITGTGAGSSARLLLQNNTGLNTADIYVTRVGWGLGAAALDDRPASGGPLTWSPVRFAESATAAALTFGLNSGQARTFTDFDVPTGRPLLYRTRMGLAVGSVTVISPNSAYQTMFTTLPTRTFLRSATDPTLGCVVYRSEGQSVGGPTPTFSRAEDAAIFHPLGRDGGPVKVRDWVGGEDGELIAVTTSEKQAQRLDDLVKSSTVLQVQWARGGLSYVLVTARPYDQDTYSVPWIDVDDTLVNTYLDYRVWSISYVETTSP